MDPSKLEGLLAAATATGRYINCPNHDIRIECESLLQQSERKLLHIRRETTLEPSIFPNGRGGESSSTHDMEHVTANTNQGSTTFDLLGS